MHLYYQQLLSKQKSLGLSTSNLENLTNTFQSRFHQNLEILKHIVSLDSVVFILIYYNKYYNNNIIYSLKKTIMELWKTMENLSQL